MAVENINQKYYFTFLNIINDIILSDDENEDDLQYTLHKVEHYAEDIVPKMKDNQFRTHFRMLPQTFEHLLEKLHTVQIINFEKGRPETLLEKQLMVTLWYLGNLESFRSVADRFNLSKSTCWSIVIKICKKLLLVNEKYKIIIWPTENRAKIIINDFFKRTKFPKTIGAIDGSHIPIKSPTESAASYVNRKGFTSVLLQAVCDNNMLFLDCYSGEVGSIHDSCLFRRSDLCDKINRGLIKFYDNSHLVGDPAYVLTNYMMVPFKDNGYLTEEHKNYNFIQSKTRVVIEQAFALLKGRFRRLKLMETVRLDLINMQIIAACILHNVCLLESDRIDIDLQAELWEENTMQPNIHISSSNIPQNINGTQKRNNIVNSLSRI